MNKNNLRRIGNKKHSKLNFKYYYSRKSLRKHRSDQMFKKISKYHGTIFSSTVGSVSSLNILLY